MSSFASLFVILSIVSTSYAGTAEICPRIVKSKAIINQKEDLVLLVETTPENKIVYQSCINKKVTDSGLEVNNCRVVGSDRGYSVGEIMSLNKSLSKGKWLQRGAKAGIILGLGVAGFYGGAVAGLYLGDGAGHGLGSIIDGMFGAIIGGVAGPVCGGIAFKTTSARWTHYVGQQKSLKLTVEALSNSGIIVTQESVWSITKNLTDALRNIK